MPIQTSPRICLLCKFFYMTQATPGYSELTPGSDFSMGCNKNHWEFSAMEETPDTYRVKMETAKSCKDYIHHKG